MSSVERHFTGKTSLTVYKNTKLLKTSDEDNDNSHKESNENIPLGNDSTSESQTHQDKALTTLKSIESEICNKFMNLFSKVSSMGKL